MEKLNILFLNHNTENYGTYFRCVNLAKALAQRGHRITLICSTKEDFSLKIRRRRQDNLTTILLPRIKVSHYHTGHTLRALLNSVYVIKEKFDILHSFVFPVHPISIPTIAARIFKRNSKIFLDGDDLWKGGWANYYGQPFRYLLERTEDILPRIASGITVVSELMKKRFIEAGIPESKIYYIPNCPTFVREQIDKYQARERIGVGANDKLLISMGHTYTECLFIMLDAFAAAADKMPALKLIFLGEMALSESFKERMKDYLNKYPNRIILAGEKNIEGVKQYIAASDLLLLPMDNNPIEEARFPIRLGDYLTSGRPIVSNAVGEVRRIIEKYQCGYLAEPTSSNDFSDKIITALTDGNAYIMGQNAMNLVDNFLNWETVAKDLETAYYNSIEKR